VPAAGTAAGASAFLLRRTRNLRKSPWASLSYEVNDDPVGTTDLEIFVLRFFALFVALLAAFLSAFFAIFRNLLCLTMVRSVSRFGYPSHFKELGQLSEVDCYCPKDARLV
jgi:hypothetical protein